MGFDIYGKNPVIHNTKYPTFNKYSDMDWKEKDKLFKKDTKLESKYWDESDKRQEDNKGIYFRNNCWWWRPLWNYVCSECDDILDDSDCEAGGWNDGKIIAKEKAKKIAKRLKSLLEDGTVKKFEVSHEAERLEAEQNNKGKKMKDEGYSWSASYPFSEDNVREFANFCAESGGFSIC